MSGDEIDSLEDGLPQIEGGWELREVGDVRLWIPREPDALLDDEEVQARNRFNDTMPYWAWLWESAPRMTETLLQRGVNGRVLEVGAGLGLVGLAIAKQTACDLVLSDYDPLSQAALRVNARLNGLTDVKVWDLDWRELTRAPEGAFDLVIGCDVIYEGQAHEPLLDVLDHYLEEGGVAHFADPGRSRVPQFLKRAQARGYAPEIEGANGQPARPETGEYRLLTLRRP